MKFLEIFSLLLICGYSSGKLENIENCGKSLAAVGRIVNGVVAQPGEYPWMASIYERENGVWDNICGGTILNKNWVITAAHCFNSSFDIKDYAVYVGLHDTRKVKDENVQKLTLSKIVIHNKYNTVSHENDLALLKTATPININLKKHVNAICVPPGVTNPTGSATVLGWGRIADGEDAEYSDKLRAVTVSMVDWTTCKNFYSKDEFEDVRILPAMLCAGGKGKGTCSGDSGGPLFQVDNKGVASLIGVASFVIECGLQNYPDVYTKVSAYRSWIDKTIV